MSRASHQANIDPLSERLRAQGGNADDWCLLGSLEKQVGRFHHGWRRDDVRGCRTNEQ